jgi:hypothetical protein
MTSKPLPGSDLIAKNIPGEGVFKASIGSSTSAMHMAMLYLIKLSRFKE